MKLKTMMACLLALLLAVPGGDMYAQTRKKSGTAKRKTTAPAKKKAAAPAGKALTKARLVDHGFHGICVLPEFDTRLGKDVGMYTWLALNPDDMDMTIVGKELGGTWSVSGSTLSFITGKMKATLNSTNGRVFKGRLVFDGGSWGMTYYMIKNGKFTPESLKNSFNNGTLCALVEVDTPRDEELVFPVDIKFVPNEDGTGGTYKFTADNNLGLGLIKGTYTFTENSVKFTSNLDDCLDREVKISDARESMCPQIGKKYIDSVGQCKIYLWLFNQ